MNEQVLTQLTRIANALEILVGQGSCLDNTQPLPPASAPLPVEVPPVQTPAPVLEVAAEPAQALTHDDLKAACLALVRKMPATKGPIKDLLSDFGAKKINEVPAARLQELSDRLAELEQGA